MTERTVSVNGLEEKVAVKSAAGEYVVTRGERNDQIRIIRISSDEVELDLNGAHLLVPYVRDGSVIRFQYRGEQYGAEVSSPGQRRKARGRDHSTAAPMPGLVIKIFVAVGEVVEKGKPLLILEAMKMEHQITAPYGGIVRELHCKAGEMVQPGVELVMIEKQETS
ncbi:MAG TPA: acetyl-CoA carboxylase biotin carboxyl carrier protein subunit [Thermoanaerobaculia bacterium]|nr:acetyl-CoA carboxylase biotin carboxyl carrier protein subunit [Thermoanaerobaculia bacterium]